MKPGLTVLYGQSPEFSTSFQTGELARHLSPWFEIAEWKLSRGKVPRVWNNYLRPMLKAPRADYFLYGNDGLADLRRFHGKTILYWYDAPDDWSIRPPQDFKNRLRLQNVISADHVLSVSAAQFELAKKFRRERTHYLPVGVDCEFFDPARVDRELARQEFGIKPGEVVLGYLGYLGKWGGRFAGEMLLEALPLIKNRLLLIGSGPAMEDWKKKAGELGVRERIIFAGYVPQDRLAAAISAADICVDTLEPGFHSEARSETKLKQYLAMGRPCVATAIGENVVDLNQGAAGLLVAPSAQALAGGIDALSDDEARRATLGVAARERAKNFYDWRILSQRLAAYLEM